MPGTTPTDSPLKVIIVGAGIAGLAAARALREHDVVVLEQSRMKAELGVAIHLGCNASKIALKWGMDLEKLGSPECTYYKEFNPITGEPTIDSFIPARKAFGAPWLLNHRVDLHNELRRLATTEDLNEVAGKPAVIRTSARVTSVDCEAGTVTLEDGEVIKGDVIIGADGSHSVLRTAVLGHELTARPSGHSAYRCLIPAEVLLKDEKLAFLIDPAKGGAITGWAAEDRRVVVYPCREFQFLNVVAIIPDQFLAEDSSESWQAEGKVEDLVAAYSSFTPEVQRLLSYAPSVGRWQLRDQDPLDTWVRGHAIIIGDAAHAPHVRYAAFIPARLKLVEQVRIERAGKIQGYSRMKALGPKAGGEGQPSNWSVNPNEFAACNFGYDGAVDWAKRMGIELAGAKVEATNGSAWREGGGIVG